MSLYGRTLSDGERDIWNEMQRDAAPDADDYRQLGRERRGVSAGKRRCTACRMTMPTGTPWVASFAIWREYGRPTPVYHCHCEGECPQTEWLCDACEGRGGDYHPAWCDDPEMVAARFERCETCGGKGRVPKDRPRPAAAPAAPLGPDEVAF